MRAEKCDEILMAAMAVGDGEEPGLPIEQIHEHIEGCESCRLETMRIASLMERLQSFERRETPVDLWPAVSGGIVRQEMAWLSKRGALVVVALVLVAYKLAEMLPANYPGHLLKIAPVVAAAALFIFLKENPFKINTELTMEQ